MGQPVGEGLGHDLGDGGPRLVQEPRTDETVHDGLAREQPLRGGDDDAVGLRAKRIALCVLDDARHRLVGDEQPRVARPQVGEGIVRQAGEGRGDCDQERQARQEGSHGDQSLRLPGRSAIA